MKYEKPEMELLWLMKTDVITKSIMSGDEFGGSGGEDDDDSLDFGGGFN